MYIGSPEVRPADWLQFIPGAVNIYMTADEYDDVYHILHTEHPAYCTALDLFGIQVGAVRTELDLSIGEPAAAVIGSRASKRSSSAPVISTPTGRMPEGS